MYTFDPDHHAKPAYLELIISSLKVEAQAHKTEKYLVQTLNSAIDRLRTYQRLLETAHLEAEIEADAKEAPTFHEIAQRPAFRDHAGVGPSDMERVRNCPCKIGPKVTIGVSHSPDIKEGAYQVGTSSPIDLEYTKGPVPWNEVGFPDTPWNPERYRK